MLRVNSTSSFKDLLIRIKGVKRAQFKMIRKRSLIQVVESLPTLIDLDLIQHSYDRVWPRKLGVDSLVSFFLVLQGQSIR